MITARVSPCTWGRLEVRVDGVLSGEPSVTSNLAGQQMVKLCRLDGSRGGTRQCEKLRKAAT